MVSFHFSCRSFRSWKATIHSSNFLTQISWNWESKNLGKSRSGMFFPVPRHLRCHRREIRSCSLWFLTGSWSQVGIPFSLQAPAWAFQLILFLSWLSLKFSSLDLLIRFSEKLRTQNLSWAVTKSFLGCFYAEGGIWIPQEGRNIGNCVILREYPVLYLWDNLWDAVEWRNSCCFRQQQEIAGIILYFLFICSRSNMEW